MKYRKCKKKLEKDIFNRVELMNPSKDDIILLYYPLYEIHAREMYIFFRAVKNAFKRNKVLAIPDRTTVSSFAKEDLKKYIDELQKQYDMLEKRRY